LDEWAAKEYKNGWMIRIS